MAMRMAWGWGSFMALSTTVPQRLGGQKKLVESQIGLHPHCSRSYFWFCLVVILEAQQQRLSVVIRKVVERDHHYSERGGNGEFRRAKGNRHAGLAARRQGSERSRADGAVEGVERRKRRDDVDVGVE